MADGVRLSRSSVSRWRELSSRRFARRAPRHRHCEILWNLTDFTVEGSADWKELDVHFLDQRALTIEIASLQAFLAAIA